MNRSHEQIDTAKTTNVPTVLKGHKNMPEPNKLRNLSRDPNKAMQEMMETIDALRMVYEKETQALKAGDVDSFMALQEEKLFNAYQYQANVKSLIERADQLKEQGQDKIISELKEKYAAFQDVSTNNVAALDRMNRIIGRITERLINAAKRAAINESVSYSAAGTMKGSANQVVTTGVIEQA